MKHLSIFYKLNKKLKLNKIKKLNWNLYITLRNQIKNKIIRQKWNLR